MDEGMKRFPFAKRFRVGGNLMGNHYGRVKEKLTVRPQSANPPKSLTSWSSHPVSLSLFSDCLSI